MRVYESDKIRNVAILGHAGSGKSNLIEAIHYTAGLANRISKPTDPIKLTTTVGLYAVEYNNYKYNFLDTPGYLDFQGDMISALRAASGAIILVDGTTDLQVGTENALEMTDELDMPKFILVNKIDSEKADYEKILVQLREKYG